MKNNMGKSIHMMMAEMLKKPPMASQPKKALHNQLNNVTNVKETIKKPKKGLSNKRKPTGEMAVFKEMAIEGEVNGCVIAKHIDEDTGEECTKLIRVEDLRPENFSHDQSKKQRPDLRLDKKNIFIVSRAYHHKEHTGKILRVKFPN